MDGNAKAISPQGIVHNETKIGVQDGMCEDLVNLRFKDGSWRPSGAGLNTGYKFGRGNASMYFIHTNVYRHLLAVDSGKLYWVAILDADGNFYTGATGETACEEHDKAREVFYGSGNTYTPAEITSVTGNVKLTQTGHIITIIDEDDDFEFFVYKTSEKQYIEVNVDVNGKQHDRKIYPFGELHFNLVTKDTDEYVFSTKDDNQYVQCDKTDINYNDSPACVPKSDEATTHSAAQIWHSQMLQTFKKASEKNKFTSPMLVVAAIKLYDGNYTFASNPVLLNPREKLSNDDDLLLIHNAQKITNNKGTYPTPGETPETGIVYEAEDRSMKVVSDVLSGTMEFPVYSSGTSNSVYCDRIATFYVSGGKTNKLETVVRGYDIALTLDNFSILKNNANTFASLAIFVTTPAYWFDMSEDAYKDGEVKCYSENKDCDDQHTMRTIVGNVTYKPKRFTKEQVVYALLHSPFYLLREYNVQEMNELESNPIINLSDPEYDGILETLTSRETLSTEAFNKNTYLPKVVYNYNSRLHIADYKAFQFHGFPLDMFHKHNHSVKYEDGASYLGLPNLANNLDSFWQYEKEIHSFVSSVQMIDEGTPTVWAMVEIETESGTQKVCRYIPAASGLTLEDLNPLICFPDYRATKLTLSYAYNDDCIIYSREFTLKPHPYLNMAYYFDPLMKPIKWIDSNWQPDGLYHPEDIPPLVQEQNVEEYFPNGLKVSSTINPMFFPVENTYQVGSAQILALCSNTIAVGTGQTGDAPLYVFCKDGIYALFVDASGQMAYPNARAIARDVLNNPKSVTPIDAGVAFTTDRGLMLIAGEQVQEIGQPLEGDYVRIAVDAAKYGNIVNNAWTDARLAGLAGNAYTGADFLTFLKGSILNYNHNEWELMVSNPSYNYTYILDKNNAWSRRDYSARTYVNNYPSSYRVDSNGFFYQVDKQSDDDNRVFFLTREIKLDSIGFKSLQRVVVRGSFETKSTTTTVDNVETTEYKKLGLYVFGSHDARRWACLGHRERQGAFTDIGTLVERTDCKFFCFALAGQLKKESRLDYIEVSVLPSKLGTKIR